MELYFVPKWIGFVNIMDKYLQNATSYFAITTADVSIISITIQ